MADSFLAAQWPGIHCARNVHREFDRPEARPDARDAIAASASRSTGASAAGAQRKSVLLQDLRATGRCLHGNEYTQWLQQKLRVEGDE